MVELILCTRNWIINITSEFVLEVNSTDSSKAGAGCFSVKGERLYLGVENMLKSMKKQNNVRVSKILELGGGDHKCGF